MKAYGFKEAIENAQNRAMIAQKEFKDSGSMCLNCKKNPGETDSEISHMHCKECNAETEKLLKQLRGPGFAEFKIPINK